MLCVPHHPPYPSPFPSPPPPFPLSACLFESGEKRRESCALARQEAIFRHLESGSENRNQGPRLKPGAIAWNESQRRPPPSVWSGGGLLHKRALARCALLLVAALVAGLAEKLAVLLLRHALATLLDHGTHDCLFSYSTWWRRHRPGVSGRHAPSAAGAATLSRGSGHKHRQ